jgi:hypothetical protein
LKTTKIRIRSYSGNLIIPLGEIETTISLREKKLRVKFLVVNGKGNPLLGLPSGKQFNLFNIIKISQSEAILHELFQEEGKNYQIDDLTNSVAKLGLYTKPVEITLKKGAVPVHSNPRRLPIRIKQKVKEELDRMINLGVIEPQIEPTEWCHPLLVVDKKDGTIRLCLDPRRLNEWIERPVFQLPTPDALLSELGEAEVMSTLDMNSGFWQLAVTPATSELLVFNTPFGRYKFK